MTYDGLDDLGEHDPEDGYTLVMPFVVTTDAGGPYESGAFVAGARFGQDSAELRAEQPDEWQRYVYPPMVPQYDLLAMRYGYAITVEPWAEHPDEWALVTLRKVPS